MSTLNVDLPAEVSVEEAKFLLTSKLYEIGRLSLGQAAALAGFSKRTFIELLGKSRVPIYDYPATELKDELSL